MDNLFEVLIYLLIIISFLSSFFKKKEVPKPTQKPQSSTEQVPLSKSSQQQQDIESSGYGILEELESIFDEDLGRPKTTPSKSQYDYYSDQIIHHSKEKKYYQNENIENKVSLEHQLKFQRRKIEIDEKTEKAASAFEEMLNEQFNKKRIVHPLIKKIKNPSLIKDYILVSEILNKPLALRK